MVYDAYKNMNTTTKHQYAADKHNLDLLKQC